MKIELDEKEYLKLKSDSFNSGFKNGYIDAGILQICKRDKDWRNGDLHVVCKSSYPYCPVCEFKNTLKKEEKKNDENNEKARFQKIESQISQIINKKFPTGSKDRYKGTDLYDKLMKVIVGVK